MQAKNRPVGNKGKGIWSSPSSSSMMDSTKAHWKNNPMENQGKGEKVRMNSKPVGRGKGPASLVDADGNEINIKDLLKDIEFLGSSRMTWKEKKELENRKVVSLGGKPPKKHRMPLSVARVSMKKQKAKQEKMLKEGMVLGHFGGSSASSSNRGTERKKAEDRVLRSSEGHFSKGVLDVSHLLKQDKPRENEGAQAMGGGKKKKGSKNKGKGKKGGKKGGGKKRR